VLKNGPTLGAGHQAWQMNEINKLVWPNPSGIGVVPAAAVAATAKIAKTYGVIKKTPAASAVNYTYARKALAQLKAAGVNTTGTGFKAVIVKVTVAMEVSGSAAPSVVPSSSIVYVNDAGPL